MWESSRHPDKQHKQNNDVGPEAVDTTGSTHQWNPLQEEVLETDLDVTQLSGDLSFPQLHSQKKRPTAKKAARTGRPKQANPKQQTLDQTLSDMDMERLLKKYREVANADDNDDDEGALDISKFLQDDDDDGDDDGEADRSNYFIGYEGEGGGSVAASDFLETLTTTKQQHMKAPNASQASNMETNGTVPLVRLEDEALNFQSNRSSASAGSAIAAAPRSDNTKVGGAGYLTVEEPKQAFEISSKLQSHHHDLASPPRNQAQCDQTGGLFYWFDAREQPHTLSVDPGSIFLFGKILTGQRGSEQFRSCCLRVFNLQRCVFLLPKPNSTDMEVISEINEACRAQGIEQRRIKFVDRYYAFEEPDVPREKTRWAKLRYSAKYPPFDSRKSLTRIQSVMGSATSLLELFLIKRKLKGPCFLRISDMKAAVNRVSHCDLEFITESPKNVVVEEVPRATPPFTIAGIQLHSQLDNKGVASEIYVASVVVYRDVSVDNTIMSTPDDIFTGVHPGQLVEALPHDLETYCARMGLPGVHRFNNEGALLKWFIGVLKRVDADMLVGHNFVGFTLATLLRRCQELNVPGWSAIGRLDLKRFPRFQAGSSSNQEKETCIGRLIVDSYLLAREYFNTINYKLLSLSEQMQVKGIAQGDTSFEPGSTVLESNALTSSKNLFDVLLQVCNCAVLSVGVVSHLDAVRLTKRLTSIAGNLWSRTLCGARSERIEYLLLHAFHDLKFITPDKKTFDRKRGRDENEAEDGKRKAKYQGGMVLDPKCGLYSDYILLLDFNSLYPSLIQEFNVCFTTVDRDGSENAAIPPPENLICAACALANLPSPCLHKCVLPKVIKGLVDSRSKVKELMKRERDPNEMSLLEIRQKALKLTANSMYGCLGFEHSRFHAQPLAELVTRQGRLALQNTVDLIPQINPSLRVIYGDTDSVMIQTGNKDDIKAVRDLGLELKSKINKHYKSLEIDIDGVFRAILLLKKKKYAALSVVDWQGEGKTYKREVKGLDMVRRDWCPLSKKVSDAVLTRVLNAEGGEDVLDYIVNYMRDVSDHVRLGDRYKLDDFVISKSLTKEPEAYRGSTFPHASVALRMKQRKELVRVGDLIPYVICGGEKLSDKAYHVDEVRHNTSLHIDAEWYLSVQIYPPVMRLCEHIQGFSSEQLSEAMGVAYHRSIRNDDTTATNDATDDFSHCNLFKNRALAECFPTVVPLQVQCGHCLRMTPIDPHQRVAEVLAATAETADDAPDRDSNAPGQFDLYVCVNCNRSLPVDYVANCFTQLCYQLFRQFYSSGGSAAAVRALRAQFTYFRALFDAPHAPGCPPRVKEYHQSRARRCLGMNRQLYTLAEAEIPQIAKENEPVDPLHATAESFYKRIDHLFVNLDALFTL